MEEAEYLCDEIAIVDQGVIIAAGSPAELIRQYGGMNAIILPKTASSRLPPSFPFAVEERDEETLAIHIDEIHRGLNVLMEMEIDLRGISIHSPNLEDVFLHLTGKRLRE
jgi:ABC-2 type transport system ATP-binding protein